MQLHNATSTNVCTAEQPEKQAHAQTTGSNNSEGFLTKFLRSKRTTNVYTSSAVKPGKHGMKHNA